MILILICGIHVNQGELFLLCVKEAVLLVRLETYEESAGDSRIPLK